MKRTLVIPLVFALALAGATLAQSLRAVLPAETLGAVGTQGLSQQQDLLQDFIAEFNRLGVADAVQAALAGAEQQAQGGLPDMSQIPEELKGLSVLDFVGDEAWLAVSAGTSNPLPAVTLVANVDAKAQRAVAAMIDKNASEPGVQKLSEGSVTFYVATVDAGTTGGDANGDTNGMPTSTPVAYAQDGSFVALSTNPDTLRGVLRRHQGASEPSFTDADGYGATLANLSDGNVFTYFDAGAVARLVEPFIQGQGFDEIAKRAVNALTTIGTRGTVARVTQQGIETQAILALDGSGKDTALHNLLTSATPASTDPFAFVPSTALSVQSGRADLGGWWNYLGDLVAAAPQLGIADLDQFVTGMTGLSLRTTLFDWMGTSFASIVTDAPTVSQPAMATSNMLGDTVILIQANDEAAAATGLGQFFTTVATQVGAFTSAGDTAASANATTRDVGGVTVASYAMGPGITVSYAVTNGYALIATSDTAMDKALDARSQGAKLPATLDAMRGKVPQDATSFALTDDRASMEAAADTLAQGLQMAAGLGGSKGLDFDKVQAASDAVKQFLTFVASRLGGAVAYSQVSGGTITNHSSEEVSWH